MIYLACFLIGLFLGPLVLALLEFLVQAVWPFKYSIRCGCGATSPDHYTGIYEIWWIWRHLRKSPKCVNPERPRFWAIKYWLEGWRR